MNPLDFNEFLHGNHETSTPNKFSNDINPSIQMKMLLKNKSLDSQHKGLIHILYFHVKFHILQRIH